MTESKDDELFYKGQTINLGVSTNVASQYLKEILSPANIDKYINENDMMRLSKFLPEKTLDTREEMKNILKLKSNSNKASEIYKPPVEIFKTMLSRNYFNQTYQRHLDRLKLDGVEEYINIFENTLNHIEKSNEKYSSQLMAKDNDNFSETEMAQIEYYLNFDENVVNFETNSYLASSGYTTLNSDDEKESSMTEIFREQTMEIESIKHNEAEPALDGSLSDERFRNLKMNKNQLTIRPRLKEELKEFQNQEFERYKFPHLPWSYTNQDDSVSVVCPVQKKVPTGTVSKPRDHVMLKSDRPAYVTILCLVRDAASRLPEGVGTRADICDLLKDSQYINERLSDAQVRKFLNFFRLTTL